MTDEEMAKFMGLNPANPKHLAVIASLSAETRASFESMMALEHAIELWAAGLGPKPTGVMIDMARGKRRRRTWKDIE
jgi:hypothetical protein